MKNHTLINQSPLRHLLGLGGLLFTGGLHAETKFDLNTDISTTQDGWSAAPLGMGTDGTISITTTGVGGLTVDSRERGINNAGGAEAEMWQDFIFANGSFAAAPDTGMQITISGLLPETAYNLTVWGFDSASGFQADGLERAADWSTPEDSATLTFDATMTPTTLVDYRVTIRAVSDAGGIVVLNGIVAMVNPSSSHNVFLNGLQVSDPIFDTDDDGLPDSFEQAIIDADPSDTIITLTDVLPSDDFDNDGSDNEEEFNRLTDPVDEDSDDDLALDGSEDGGGVWVSATETGTNPLIPDTDGDGVLDGVENPDLDYDPQNPTAQPGSDPHQNDSDQDGYRDGRELEDGTDPTDPLSFLDPFAIAVARFDFNAPGSPTLSDWTAAESGNGTNGIVSVTTEAIGGVTVDTRDRPTENTDGPAGDLARNDLWRDFVFANGSLDSAPGSGLKLTLTGLAPLTIYPITIWAFDEASNNGRQADWGETGKETTLLTFPTSPDPSTLEDYSITFEASTDATGTLVIDGIVATEDPDVSHNVFVNALVVGRPTGSNQLEISLIEYDAEAGRVALTWNSLPGGLYSVNFSSDLQNWDAEIADNIPATEGSQTTRFEFSNLGLPSKGFFRVSQ